MILATIGVAAAIYEWLSVRYKRTPTITDAIRALPWPLRVAVALSAAAAVLDHFLFDVVL